MAEIGQPVSDLFYKQWDAEFKSRETKTVEKERVVAYLVGPGSIMPLAGRNPYLDALEEMAGWTNCKNHRRKYENTIQFLNHFSNSS